MLKVEFLKEEESVGINVELYCRFRNCRLERPGPPNQRFFSCLTLDKSIFGHDDVEHSDKESVVDEIEEHDNVEDDLMISWEKHFGHEIVLDNRGN